MEVREERGLELLDAGASKVFCVADHQVGHIYFNDKSLLEQVKSLLSNIDGIEEILDEKGKRDYHIDHDRSGDLVVVADKNSWFTYYYWLDDRKAPDFARTVDIHRKPGYDPLEMLTDPLKSFMTIRVLAKILKKKMGFRTLMDVIPLNAELIKGSHGRISQYKSDWPVLIYSDEDQRDDGEMEAVDVFGLIIDCLLNKPS